MNICDKTDVGANNVDTGSTAPRSRWVMKSKNNNVEQNNNRQNLRKEA